MSEFIFRKSERLCESYYITVHKSGLRIIVFPKKLNTCYAVLGTDFGSADLVYKENGYEQRLPVGTAHFLEHKMFENADGINSDERFTALGAEANAYTSYNSTRYLFSATDRYAECLRELVRMVTSPYFTPENVKKERGIIEQEILMYADDPYERVMENCLASMYPRGGVGKSICGSASSISKITESILYKAHKAFYNPSNMILSVSGDITPEEVINAVDRELPVSAVPFTAYKVNAFESETVTKKRVEQKMKVARPLFFIGVRDDIPDDAKERIRRSLAMTVLNNMLFAGTGEFYNRLLDERLITPSFSFGYSSGRVCAMNYFSGNSDEPEKVFGLICEKMSQAADGMLNADDFIRCRRSLLASFFKSFDSTSEIADDVMYSYIASGVDPFCVPDIIESLTFGEIESNAKVVFGKPDRVNLSLILPL